MVRKFVLNSPDVILEPSVGQGDLVEALYHDNSALRFDMYEIDEHIKLLEGIPQNVIFGDFLRQDVSIKYKTIIGNPPFVRTRKGNLYVDFIEKCYHLLEDNGEMVFIIPSDFFKLTCAAKLLQDMLHSGTFTHIYHPHNEGMFDNASIDVLVFRYCFNSGLSNEVLYNDEVLYIHNNDGFVSFGNNMTDTTVSFNDYFDIYVGLVTGKESVFKSEVHGNIEVRNGVGTVDKYIFMNEFPSSNEYLNSYMMDNKNGLINRKIRKFNEHNWFEWGAPRNMKTIDANRDKDCIYIHNLTRHKNVAFRGTVGYFGGGLLILIPKEKINIDMVVAYLNGDDFKSNFMFSGRFKIGHRQISKSYIPAEIL
jgi:adenine-specific DNA-methyltransferase